MLALISLALLMVLPSQALGLSLSEGILLFNVPSTDQSIIYLGQFLGGVGNVLPGAPGLLSHLFAVLNGTVFVFVGVIVSYVLVKSVVKTAMEGKVLGEQANYWIVVRTVGGLLALVPKFTGYSFIQVVVMWAVVQSIGLADSTWNATLDFFDKGGSFYDTGASVTDGVASTPQKKQLLMEALTDSATLLNSAVCMYLMQEKAHLTPTSSNTAYFDPFTAKLGSITFGTADNVEACGSYVLQNVMPISASIIKSIALTQLASRLMPLALNITKKRRVDNQQSVASCVNCGETRVLLAAAVEYAEVIKSAWPSVKSTSLFEKSRAEGWITAGSHYNDLMQSNGHAPVTPGWLTQPPNAYGFHASDKVRGLSFKTPNTANTVPNWAELKDLHTALGGKNADQYFYNVSAYYSQAAELVSPNTENLSPFRQAMRQLIETYVGNALVPEMRGGFSIHIPSLDPVQLIPPWFDRKELAFNVIEKDVRTMVTAALTAWKDTIVPASMSGEPYANPIARSKHLGTELINIALTFMQDVTQHTFNILVVASTTMTATLMVLAFGFGRLGGHLGRNLAVAANVAMQMGFQILGSHVFWYLPLGAAIAAPMLAIGVSLAGYIPMLPFIVFTFAVIGWFIAVLEAMVAAPLVAFGMTHPEGHDVLGKTEQGLMLLLSLFIRPVCMLIGLLTGLVLVYLGTELFDLGYLDLTLQLITDATTRLGACGITEVDFTVNIITMILLALYTFILMAVVSQCMTAVYVLPDKIMRWIGLPPESSGIAGMLEQTKSGTESKMGEGAHAGAGMGGDMRHSGIQPSATKMKGKEAAGGTASGR